MQKKVVPIIWIIISVALTIIYFSYNITLSFDSCQFVYLSEMFSGNVSFSNWAAVRSFVFPMGIWLTSVLFGKSRLALLIGTFAFYAIMLICMYLMYNDIVKKHESNKYIKAIFIVLAIILIPLNPIILGFYHVILTEFASITITILMSYLVWKWMNINFENEKIKYIIFSTVFVILTIISWHLKQTYLLCSIVPLIISTIISLIENHNWKNVLQRIIVVLICMISLFISIKIWNVVLEKNEVTVKKGHSSAGLLGTMIIEGVSNYRTISFDKYTKEYIEENEKISPADKEKLLSILNKENDTYKSFILLKRLEGINTKYEIKPVYIKGEEAKTIDGISFIMNTLKEEPLTVFDSYIANYLGISDIYRVRVNLADDYYYYVERTYSTEQDLEINYLAYNTFRNGTSGLGVPEHWKQYAEEYISNNEHIRPVNDYMIKMLIPIKITFKFSLVLLPILWIAKIVQYFIIRKKYQEQFLHFNHLVFILYSYAIISMLMHTVLGALMDRYAVSAYVCTLIALMFDIYVNIIRRKGYKGEKNAG